MTPSRQAWLPLALALAACAPAREPDAPESADPAPGVDAPAAEPWLLPQYRAWAEAEIGDTLQKRARRAITEDERAEASWLLEQRTRALPAEIGRELAGRALRTSEALDDLQRLGALGLLNNLVQDGAGPLGELVESPAALDALFVRAHDERRVEVNGAEALRAALAPGVTARFPAGRFELGPALGAPSELAPDVTLAGAGTDRTLFTLSEPIGSPSAIERFTLADCTLLVTGKQLFDQRAAAALVRLRGVRVIGFDHGAPGSGLFAFERGVVLDVRDARFEGGFGSLPGSGAVLRVPNAAVVARFEDCTFEGLSLALARLRHGVTLRFERCTIAVLDDPLRDTEHERGIRLADCRVEARRPPPAARTLEELFPANADQR